MIFAKRLAATVMTAGLLFGGDGAAWSQSGEGREETRRRDMADGPVSTGYVPVNGPDMYYEIHGAGGTPLVLLHGAFSAIGTSFGPLPPELSKDRQVIALELQGYGHTADIDRPLSMDQMAEDAVAALGNLAGLLRSQLAILSGTSHVSMIFSRADLLLPTIVPFLDAAMPGANRSGSHAATKDKGSRPFMAPRPLARFG